MNQVLDAFAKQYNATYDKERNTTYGNAGGYQAVLTEQNKKEVSLVFTVNSEREDFSRDQVVSFLANLKNSNPAVTYQAYNGYQVTLYIKASKSKDAAVVGDITRRVSEFLMSLDMKNCCQYCGDIQDAALSSVNGQVGVLCSSCMYKFKDTVKEEEKGNIGLGILGAIGGSLIGVAAWILIYQLGFIAGIAGFLMFYCAFAGYQKLGKRNDSAGVWISLLISIFMLAFSEYLCLVIALAGELTSFGYTVMDCFSLGFEVLADTEVVTAVIGDLVMGYLLMAFATAASVKQCAKNTKHKSEAVRLS